MAVYRNKKQDNFTVLDNSVMQNDNLSWKAKGILTYLLSLPTDWDVHLKEIEEHATDGITSLRSGIKELREAGYIKYHKYKDDKGKFQHRYNIYEFPKMENPDMENPSLDNPDMENSDINKELTEQRTNKEKTNKQNNMSANADEYPTLSSLPRNNGGHRKYPDKFQSAWQEYPNRDGSANKGGGYSKFRARIKEGVDADKLIKAAKKYKKEKEIEGSVGTKYIMQMSKFYGAKDIWLEYAEKDITADTLKGVTYAN